MVDLSIRANRRPDPVIDGLKKLLSDHIDKRVVVVGTTCTGKSTLISQIPGARDQDAEVFPLLTKEEAEYVCQEPWTQEIGETMVRLVRERVRTEAGRPVFGTVVLESDLLIVLKISDNLLATRTAQRKVNLQDAKNMQAQILTEVKSSGIPWMEYSVG